LVGAGHTISRASVAAWILDAAESGRHIHENVVISG
jgi:hypothetical protein